MSSGRITLACLVWAMVGAGADGAAFLVDNTTIDLGDLTPGDGLCEWATFPPPGDRCTLRAAIQEANALVGPDLIIVPAAAVIELTLEGRGDDQGESGDLDILDDVTITSLAIPEARPVVDANGIDRVFDIHPGVEAAIANLVITGGSSLLMDDCQGGGIFVREFLNIDASLELSGVVLVGNEANLGGGLAVQGLTPAPASQVMVSESTFAENQVWESGFSCDGSGAGRGGGAWLQAGTLVVESSTVRDNRARLVGGLANGGGTLSVRNTTIVGNEGDGVWSQASTSLFSSTIVDNEDVGVSLYNSAFGPELIAWNTIFGDGGQGACFHSAGTWSLAGHHNLDTDGTCGLNVALGDLPNADPQLGALQLNGGFTLTFVPQVGSPAIDQGDGAQCLSADQRGAPRPLDGDGVGGAECDVGAVEVLPCTTTADLLLSHQIVSTAEEFEACFTVTTGPALTVASGGYATLRARDWVALADGTEVEFEGGLVIELDPSSGSGIVLP